jgi:hypothetical protein
MFIKFKGFLIPRIIACMIYERLIVFNGTEVEALRHTLEIAFAEANDRKKTEKGISCQKESN